MRAEIISVGTELLLGEIVDTNTAYLADQLAVLGVDLYFASTVGDNQDRLRGVLHQAWQRSELIITTGGLGPTQDDITREAIASLLDEEPQVDAQLKQQLIDSFAARGREMPLSNIKQATLIPSAVAIPNPWGTAPGWWVQKAGRIIVAMPGPPNEMEYMWRNEVLPGLRNKTGAVILSRTIKTLGLGEAGVDELVTPLLSSSNPTVATYAKRDGIHLRITAKADKLEKAREMVLKREADIRAILGDYVWGVDGETLEGLVGQLLVAQGLSLAVAESFTGGFLTHILGNVPESSKYFKGSLVDIGDEARVAMGFEPEPGTSNTSDEITAAMAAWARDRLGADIGVGMLGNCETAGSDAITSISIAIDMGGRGNNAVQSYSGGGAQIRQRAAYFALSELRKLLNSI